MCGRLNCLYHVIVKHVYFSCCRISWWRCSAARLDLPDCFSQRSTEALWGRKQLSVQSNFARVCIAAGLTPLLQYIHRWTHPMHRRFLGPIQGFPLPHPWNGISVGLSVQRFFCTALRRCVVVITGPALRVFCIFSRRFMPRQLLI